MAKAPNMRQSRGRAKVSAPKASGTKTRMAWTALQWAWDKFWSFCDTLYRFLRRLLWVAAIGFVLWLLFIGLVERTTVIQPISVPKRLAEDGFAPDVAARHLRDALRRAVAKVHLRYALSPESQFRGMKDVLGPEAQFRGVKIVLAPETINLVVPATGLSFDTITESGRSFFGIDRRRSISGEISVKSNLLWLRLRIDGHELSNSPTGADTESPDELLAEAVPGILRTLQPYVLAAAEKDPRKALDQIIAQRPESDENVVWAHILKGHIYRNSKKFGDATKSLRKASDLDPDLLTPHLLLGLVLHDQRDLDGAIEEYSKAILLDPGVAYSYNYRAVAYSDRGEHDHAIADFDDAIRLSPSDPNLYFNLGLAYLRRSATSQNKELVDRAIASFSEAIHLDPHFVWGYTYRGTAHMDKQDYGRAISDYTEAIRLDPKLDHLYNNRGIAYSKRREHNLAIGDFTQAVEINPEYVLAYVNRGIAFFDKGEFDRAIADLTRAIELDPKDAIAYLKRGRAHRSKGDLDSAIVDDTETISLAYQYPDGYLDRGFVHYMVANYKGAASDFSRAIKQAPDYPYLALWLYLAQARLGNASAGVQLDANAKRLEQGSWPYPVVELFLDKKTPEKTLAAANNANERCEAHFYIGQWRLLQGDRAAAIPSLRAAAQTCPKQFIESAGAEAELRRLVDEEASRPTAAPAAH